MTLSLLGLASSALCQGIRERISEAENISQQEALAVARQNLGADTVNAIPFRNRDSDLQFIAVSTESHDSLQTFNPAGAWTIHVLEGKNGTYWEPKQIDARANDEYFFYVDNPDATNIPAERYRTSEGYRKSVFGVRDMGNDGSKEVYAVERTGGTGSYIFTISVYDTTTKKLYWLKASGEYNSPMLDHQYSSNAPQNEAVYTWINHKAEELILHQSRGGFQSLDSKDDHYEEAVQNWLRDNGRGFYEGSIEVRKFDGELPRPEQIICSVDDSTHKWVSYLKGPVVGYRKAEH